jgi:Fur family ferric uptake transcriptional regulator
MTTGERVPEQWADVPRRLRASGLRWTPQRRALLEVLAGIDGHVTGAELVERSRAIDPATTPSTVYRTLDVLEGLGLVSHSHGLEGRQEFHVRPARHGHLVCSVAGGSSPRRGRAWWTACGSLGFSVERPTIEGRCWTARASPVMPAIRRACDPLRMHSTLPSRR